MRGAVSPSEKVAKVPRKYLVLKGNHAEHPGRGLGNGVDVRQQVALDGANHVYGVKPVDLRDALRVQQ